MGKPSPGIERTRKAETYRIAIIGCGRMGQHYGEHYRLWEGARIVAIAEWNEERRQVVGKRFGVTALYKEADGLLREVVPDIAVVMTPTKFMKDAVIASAEAGAKAVQVERPMAARLSDADAMVDVCRKRGVKLGGGGLERAKWEVDVAGRWLQEGRFGPPIGASVRHYISPVGCQGCRTSVLRHFTGAEVDRVISWCGPPGGLTEEATDGELQFRALFHLTSGLECPVFGEPGEAPEGGLPGVDVWTEDTLVRWNRHGGPPFIYQGKDSRGARRRIDPRYPPQPYREYLARNHDFLNRLGYRGHERDYLVGPIWSLIEAVETGKDPWISGHDLRQALEIAIACKRSSQLGNVPVSLPLEDRSLAFLPKPYRWLGGDVSGRPQSAEEAAGTL